MPNLSYSKTFAKKAIRPINTKKWYIRGANIYRELSVYQVYKTVKIKYSQAYGAFVSCFRHLVQDKFLQPKTPQKSFFFF